MNNLAVLNKVCEIVFHGKVQVHSERNANIKSTQRVADVSNIPPHKSNTAVFDDGITMF